MAKVLARERNLFHIPRIHVNAGLAGRSTVVQPRKTDIGNIWEKLAMSGLNYETLPQENEEEEKLRRIPQIVIKPLLACIHTHIQTHTHMCPLSVHTNMKRTRKKKAGDIDICTLKYRQQAGSFLHYNLLLVFLLLKLFIHDFHNLNFSPPKGLVTKPTPLS